MPHYRIRIDQTDKLRRTVERLKGQQEDLMTIQAKFNGGADHPAQIARLDAFDEVLVAISRELHRLTINLAADRAGEALEHNRG